MLKVPSVILVTCCVQKVVVTWLLPHDVLLLGVNLENTRQFAESQFAENIFRVNLPKKIRQIDLCQFAEKPTFSSG